MFPGFEKLLFMCDKNGITIPDEDHKKRIIEFIKQNHDPGLSLTAKVEREDANTIKITDGIKTADGFPVYKPEANCYYIALPARLRRAAAEYGRAAEMDFKEPVMSKVVIVLPAASAYASTAASTRGTLSPTCTTR